MAKSAHSHLDETTTVLAVVEKTDLRTVGDGSGQEGSVVTRCLLHVKGHKRISDQGFRDPAAAVWLAESIEVGGVGCVSGQRLAAKKRYK